MDIAGESLETLRITGWTDERALALIERDGGAWTEVQRLPDVGSVANAHSPDFLRNVRAPTVWIEEAKIWVISRGKAMYRYR